MNVLYEIYFSVFRRIATSRGGGHTVRVTPGAQPAPERGGPDKGHPRHACHPRVRTELRSLAWSCDAMGHGSCDAVASPLGSRVGRLRLASAVSRQPSASRVGRLASARREAAPRRFGVGVVVRGASVRRVESKPSASRISLSLCLSRRGHTSHSAVTAPAKSCARSCMGRPLPASARHAQKQRPAANDSFGR